MNANEREYGVTWQGYKKLSTYSEHSRPLAFIRGSPPFSVPTLLDYGTGLARSLRNQRTAPAGGGAMTSITSLNARGKMISS
jgi:hypothetical protein